MIGCLEGELCDCGVSSISVILITFIKNWQKQSEATIVSGKEEAVVI